MVTVRVHRHAVEVLAKTAIVAGTHRQEIEVAIEDVGSGGTVQVHRHSIETLAKVPLIARVNRQEIEVAIEDVGSGGSVQVHRHGVEVFTKVQPTSALHRQEIEAAFEDVGSGAPVHVHRQGIEILARVGVPSPTPLFFPTALTFFLHNWVQQVEMETGYLTDISRSPTTLSEERRGLLQRPYRQMQVQFTHGTKVEVDRLMVTLRRLTRDNLVLPLFQAAVILDQSSTGQNLLNGDFRYRRFFNGARVAVFPAVPTDKAMMLDSEVDNYLLQEVQQDFMRMDRNLDQTYTAKEFLVVPLIDLELVLVPGITQLTDDTAEVQLTLNEVVGANALPPSFTGGVVDGWKHTLGLPVFEIDPDWASGIRTDYRRYGQRRVEGRKPVVVPQGPRYVQVQDFHLKLDRPDFWRVLNLFDSRRGRLDLFWEIDQEFLWTVPDTDPGFIDVSPFGLFADFENDFTDHAGIVMEDGTVYIREIVTIEDTGGVWRLTLTPADLPVIDVTQIKRFSRARKKRFDKDSLSEKWHTTEVVEMRFSTVEVLNEQEINI